MESELLLDRSESCWLRYRSNIVAAITFCIVMVALTLTVVYAYTSNTPQQHFYDSISLNEIKGLLQELQQIAISNGGSRAVRTGSAATASWLQQKLMTIPCTMGSLNFSAPSFVVNTIPQLRRLDIDLNYQYEVDFQGLRYGGNGSYNFIANLTNITNYGCEASDFSLAVERNIFLIAYGGDCTVLQKVRNALPRFPSAVLIYNNESRETLLKDRVLTSPFVVIPVFALSYSVGKSLVSYKGLLNIVSNTSIYENITQNIWCDTNQGNISNTIVLGAHMDSVVAGAGINDNGSGTSTVLQLLIQWYRYGMVAKNRIRFAWWGAEEEGLIGSRKYIQFLKQNQTDELKRIVLGLNMDMVGSPNYIPFVGEFPYGSNVSQTALRGTKYVTTLFELFFTMLQKPFELIALTEGSDHYAFLEAGIPAGRVHSGAAQIKTEDLRAKYGGIANVQADPCYHQPCDETNNINDVVLRDMAKAAAYVLETVAMDADLYDKVKQDVVGVEGDDSSLLESRQQLYGKVFVEDS